MKTHLPSPSVLALMLAATASPAAAQTVTVGGVAPDFTVVNHATGANLRLTDFAGKVVVLDFFAYWCGPCQSSSPLVDRDIQKYYAARGGNAAGLPVVVLPISIDQTNRTATDTFIRNAGLELAADDVGGEAWRQHDTNAIPTFVVLNGVRGAPGMQQWQVLYRRAGYAGADALRQVIETVRAPLASPPTITTHPAAQTALAGACVTFTVAATNPVAGTLAYRWYFTPAGSATPQALTDQTGRFTGTQTTSLTVCNIQASDTGDYVVVVSNSDGSATSNAALLGVTRPVRLVSQTALPGAAVAVPVQLLATGDENTVTFGLQFNPAKLAYVSYAAGADVAGGTITPNVSQQANGQLGFLIGKAPGMVHAAGTRTLITLTFTLAAGVVGDEIVPITFVDQPIARRIFAASGAQLPGAFADGQVTAITGLEGDINGDGEVDGGDWVKLGRVVVGLDPAPASGEAFMRADIAPRATKGDGTVDGGDWVQLGRYVVGLDALQPAGGPSSPIP